MDERTAEEEASVQQPASPNEIELQEQGQGQGQGQGQEPGSAVPEGLPAPGPAVLNGEAEQETEGQAEENGQNEQNEAQNGEEEPSMQLGDHYDIQMANGKKISGIIYYLDQEKLIRILPNGVNHKLEDLPLVEITDPDTGESYTDIDPELQVTEIVLTQKATVFSFVDLIGLRIGQNLTTFKQDQSLGPILEVTAVNSEKDSIRVVQTDDTFEREIDFNHKGIPLDEEFVIMQIKQDELPQEDQVEIESEDVGLPMEGESLEIEVLGEIVLPSRVQVQEISATERVYDERQQKNSFIEDLRTMLDVSTQNNPTVLKNIRIMTEIFSDLKNSIISRDDAGNPKTEKKISIQTMHDLLQLENIPIAKPILDTCRVIVTENGEEEKDIQTQIMILPSLINQSKEYIETMGGIEADAESVGLPRWYLMWRTFFQTFPMGDAYQSSGFTMQQDMEYFRQGAPDSSTVTGLTEIGNAKQRKLFAEGNVDLFMDTIEYSYRRGHGPTYRALPKGGTEIASLGDKAIQKGSILFPFLATQMGAVGSTRIGNLWELLKRSFHEKVWMDQILDTYGKPIEELNIHKIVHISKTNTDTIKTEFIEYLRQALDYFTLNGRGDLYKINSDLGLQEVELTPQQVQVVEEKVKQTISGIKQVLTELRKELSVQADKPKLDPFLSISILEELQKVMQKEPMLEELIKDMNNKIPSYKDLDIAIFSYLLLYAQDYSLAAISGNEANTLRERNRFARSKILETIIASRKVRELEELKGQTPQVNSCRHVKDLNKIRKIKNNSERLAILTQFLVQYDGGMDGNWVKCQRCKKHLICKHEVLQIQQLLHPKEHNILQKQIILGFAGGREGDKYICRNCGQPFADIEFDTSLEFNDDGVPMMGRKVIVDKDALQRERTQNLLGIRIEEDDENKMKFKTDTQKSLYKVLKKLIEAVGVEIDMKGISTILDMAEREVLNLESEKEYKTVKRKIKYIDYKTRRTIAILAALLLIEIQTHVPNYQVRFSVEGCKPGFGGFPLVETADPKNEDESIGIQYITCILNGIYEDEEPWSHGFQNIADKDRRETIKAFIVAYCEEFAKDAFVQMRIRAKKEFERNIYGAVASKGRPDEYIPSGFLPKQETIQEASDNAAGAPTVPEGAPRTNLGQLVLADTWIRAANRVVREKGAPNIVKDSPFMETSCCLNSIKEPQQFWNGVALPEPPHTVRYHNPFHRQSIAYTAFVPRPLQVLQETAPEGSTYYKVVLKLCYKGLHLGKPHEFGADYKCDWCDLEIPIDLQNPNIDDEGQPIISWEKVKVELDRQGVQVTEQLFQQIQDKSHELNMFPPYIQEKAMNGLELCNALVRIDPSPVPEFRKAMAISMKNLSQLRPDASEIEILQALMPLTRGPVKEGDQKGLYQMQEDNLKEVLGDDFKYLDALLNENPESIFNVLLTYFLVPAERLASGSYDYENDRIKIRPDYNLGDIHKKEIEDILSSHIDYLLRIRKDPYGILKLKTYVNTMSQLFKLDQELRITRIRFHPKVGVQSVDYFLKKIIRVFAVYTLANLIDPDTRAIDENGEEIAGDTGNSETFLKTFIREVINKYKREHLVYNPSIVKQRIEEANEMEHQRFIDYLDRLPEKLKKLEMTKKKLGIGMWAIGGTKAIYQYDPDHWESNREAVAGSYAQAAAYDPNAQLPAAMQLMDPTGYFDPNALGAQDEGYEYQFHDDE